MPKVKVVAGKDPGKFEQRVNNILKELTDFGADYEVIYNSDTAHFVAFIHYWETDQMEFIGWGEQVEM